jgi:hypothetical protein
MELKLEDELAGVMARCLQTISIGNVGVGARAE